MILCIFQVCKFMTLEKNWSLFYQTAWTASYSALVWLFGGRGFPRWCAVVRPYGLDANSSFTSGRSLNPAWKLRSNSSVGAKDRGFSSSSPPSLAFHASSKATLASLGACAGLQKIWGASTWKPQKRRTPLCTKDVNYLVVMLQEWLNTKSNIYTKNTYFTCKGHSATLMSPLRPSGRYMDSIPPVVNDRMAFLFYIH